jgi:hypothetical protein
MRFDMNCEANGINHQLTKLNYPWTSGEFERLHSKIKEVSVR